MTDNFIQLDKDDILRFKIVDANGKETGECLEFDLENIDYPLVYQDAMEKIKKNRIEIKNKINMIEQRKDIKGKKILSKNKEDEVKALQEYFKKEAEAYDMILGKDGVKKLLNGRALGWTSLRLIDKYIDEQIIPILEKGANNILDKIDEMYNAEIEDSSVLK